jgi:hypothetical protein
MQGGGSSFMGIHGVLRVEAPSRVDALIAAHRQLSGRGEVTVLGYRGGESLPLGLTAAEQEAVRSAGIPLTIGYPRAGCQIECIDPESPPARTGLRLEGLPGMVLSSWETDVGGQWTIYYETDLENARTTWWVLESEGAGLVAQARERALASGAAFDLDEARRQAADRVVVSKVRQGLEYLDRQPGGRGPQ